MKNEKILQEEVLSDEDLEKISGGSVSETDQIRNAIGQVYEVDGFKDNFSHPVKFKTYLPTNEVCGYLKKHYNIDATLNFGDFDPASHDFVTDGDPNKYSRNGQTLTHAQVLNIINGK